MQAYYENSEFPVRCFRRPGMQFAPHLHRQVELVLGLEGHYIAWVDGERCEVGPGDLLMLFPNAVHSYQGADGDALFLIFSPELVGELEWKLCRYRPRTPLLPCEQVHEDIPYCMRRLLETPRERENASLIRGYLQVVLSHVLAGRQLVSLEEKTDLDLTHRALLYVAERCGTPLTLEEAARGLGVSPSRLSRLFSREIGMSFGRYLHSLRVSRAQQLLENEELSISQIGFECGFESLRTFNRVFQSFAGCTPTAYRRQRTGAP